MDIDFSQYKMEHVKLYISDGKIYKGFVRDIDEGNVYFLRDGATAFISKFSKSEIVKIEIDRIFLSSTESYADTATQLSMFIDWYINLWAKGKRNLCIECEDEEVFYEDCVILDVFGEQLTLLKPDNTVAFIDISTIKSWELLRERGKIRKSDVSKSRGFIN